MENSEEAMNAGGENPFSLEKFLADRMRLDMRHAVRGVFEEYSLDIGSSLMYMDMLLDHIGFEAYEDIACRLLKEWVAGHVDLVEDWLGQLRKEMCCGLCKRG